MSFPYLTVAAVLTFVHGMTSQELCSQCDCTISTPDTKEGAILSIRPRCEQGQVTWLNAYGAVRMELGSSRSSPPGEIRVCVKISSEHVSTLVSREIARDVPGNYRRKIVDDVEVGLSPVFTTAGQGQEYCISGSGNLHLYMETERRYGDGGVARVDVQYDVEKKSRSLQFSPMEECRPCTDRELLKAYCSSNFVAIGTMDTVVREEDYTHIDVTATNLISQSETVFRKSTESWTDTDAMKGVVHVPLRCGIRRGEGQFLFMGRVRLGRAVLQCAPRYEQWKTVMEDAVKLDLLECSYG